MFWIDTAVEAPSTAIPGRQPRWTVLPVMFRPCTPVAAMPLICCSYVPELVMPEAPIRLPASVTPFAPAATEIAVAPALNSATCDRVTATVSDAPSMATAVP